jgi:hypothetical protein
VRFAPAVVGDAIADIVIASNDPDEDVVAVPLSGLGFKNQSDTYTQGQQVGGNADIMFVVDTSLSMSEEQNKLAQSFQHFIQWVVDANVKFNIAVTTGDMSATGEQGRFVGNPKIIDNNTPNLVTTFQNNVKVGDGGHDIEQLMEGSKRALSAPLVDGENAGFLREVAKLFIVYVSDEDDQSPGSVQSFVDFFTNLKGGNADKVFFAAIAGPTPSGCWGSGAFADAGDRYVEITGNTGGLFDTICQSNFGTTLEDLAFEVTASDGVFYLTEIPDPDTIRVYVDAAEQAGDRWTYDAAENSITFGTLWNPPGGAQVMIQYHIVDEG